MPLIISGRLEGNRPGRASLAECRVEVYFEQKARTETVEAPEKSRTRVTVGAHARGREGNGNSRTRTSERENASTRPASTRRGRASARTDKAGRFEVHLPDETELGSKKLRFIVSAPSGQTIADVFHNVDRMNEVVHITVSTQDLEPIPLEAPEEVPQPETRRITGRVIERQGKPLPANLQVLVFAQRAGEKGSKTVGLDLPIVAARADASGYFGVHTPNESYASASALVAGVDAEVPIILKDGFIPDPLLLVVDLPEVVATPPKEGCDCQAVAAPPRTPSHSDIEHAPDTYSVDLGVGRCVQFNTPNRAIEEFDFYTVVRTTEPDIRANAVDGVSAATVLASETAATETAANAASALSVAAELVATIAPQLEAAEARVTAAQEAVERSRGPLGTVGAAETNELNQAQEARNALRNQLRVASGQMRAAGAQTVAAMALAKAAAAAAKATRKPPGRAHLDSSNPVDWDATPTFYEAATIAHGHLLHFKQVWYADGYSLGDLLYSLPLAPGQKKLISVVDWERRERTARTEATFASEELNAALTRDRDLGEVVTGALTESARGGSRNTTAGVGGGHGAAGNGSYQGFNFGALVGVSGGYGESNSTAWQDSARNLSSNSLQNLRDRTLQSASAIRSIRSSVVQTVAQGEAVRATTEVVANHNHCHALTIQYFEVLRHLKLVHELADVQECVFVPLPMSEFDRPKALRWRQAMQAYLQRPELAGGFDAAQRVETGWADVDYPVNRYADEKIASLSGELELTIIIPLPPFPERPQPRPEDTLADTATAIAEATNPTTGFFGVLGAIATGGLSLLAGAATSGAINATKAAIQGARALADDFYAQPTAQERYDKFQAEVMPGVAIGFVDQLELYALVAGNEVQISGADFTLVSNYQPGVPLLVSLRATLSEQIKRGDVSQLIIKSANGLPSGCRTIINRATMRYRTAIFEHAFLDDRRVNDDIELPKVGVTFSSLDEITVHDLAPGRGAALFTPIDAWEQRNPRTEDRRLSDEVVAHLNDNIEFYHHAIWWTMDPNRRYMLLDGYLAPGSNERSVASVVENRLIGIVGNSLVLPVARGNHLDPRFAKDGKTKSVNLIDFYSLASPVPPARVSLPTRGVFAEAMLGSCNACEQIDDSRFWRWEESPIDEPPTIEPASTVTRRSEPTGAQPTPFPTPIVSIQNAPGVPDPVGVRAALDTLGKQSFADITGLAGTQANAAAAYQQALDTAFKFGKEASTLAQQAAMLKSIDKSMNVIDSAEAGGKIDGDNAKDLRMTALRKLVGDTNGASTDPADVQRRLEVIADAVKAGSISQLDAQNLSNSVLRGLSGDETTADGAAAMSDLAKHFDPKAIERFKMGGSDGSYGEILQVVARPDELGTDRPTPASKTGMSGLADRNGKTSSLVQDALDGSKELITAVGKGIADWKDKPNTELSKALADSLLEAATTAANKATDEIPMVKAMKVAAKYSLAFAQGIGEGLNKTNLQLTEEYDRQIRRATGSDGFTDEDKQALQNIRSYQLNAVKKLPGILESGVEKVVDSAIRDFANWVTTKLAKTFVDTTKSLLTHVLEKSPLKAVVAGALDVAAPGVPEARQKVYRGAVSASMSLFVRQLSDPKLRSALSGLAQLGGKEPLDKAILSAIASTLVDAAAQEPALKEFARDLNQETRAWLYDHMKEIVDTLRAKGVQVVGTSEERPSVAGDTVKIPNRLLSAIELGEEAANDQDYRKWVQIGDVMEGVRQAAERRLALLTKVRQPRLVYLNENEVVSSADAEAGTGPYARAYDKYIKEYTEECRRVQNMYRQLAGGDMSSPWALGKVIRFERVDVQNPRRTESIVFDIQSGQFQTEYRRPKVTDVIEL